MNLIGAHFSIAKGLHHALQNAHAYGCSALQLFTKNAQTWKERALTAEEIARFDAARQATGIQAVAAHTSYLINLAAAEKAKRDLSYRALRAEMGRASQLGIPHVVLHPGAHMGSGPAVGLERIRQSLNRLLDETRGGVARLLLETTAGQGSSVGHRFEDLADLLDSLDAPERVGVCFDTCHVFAAGYDLRTARACEQALAAFDAVIGLPRLELIHLNDAKKACGSRVDRHEHIGEGHIGTAAFAFILNDDRLRAIPKILETPKGRRGEPDYDRINLDRLHALLPASSQPKGEPRR